MSEIKLGKYEIGTEDFVKGAAVAAGVGIIALGIKNFFDARRIHYIEQQPFDDEAEYEVYKAKKARRLSRMRMAKINSGIIGVLIGGVIATVGVLSFTPYKDVFIDSDTVEDIKSQIADKEIKQKLADAALVKKLKEIDYVEAINNINKLRQNISNIKAINDTIDKIKERIA